MLHSTAHSVTASHGDRGSPGIGASMFDVSTGSALSPVKGGLFTGQAALVLDLEDRTFTAEGLGDPMLLGPAFSLVRQILGEHETWTFTVAESGIARAIGQINARIGDIAVKTENSRQTGTISPRGIKSDVVSVDRQTREIFGRLAQEWRNARNRYDSGARMFAHPAYQQIIGMGDRALPLIFEELRRELDHWFWALKAITREDPVPHEQLGNLEAMREHWLQWAESRGYVWSASYTRIRE